MRFGLITSAVGATMHAGSLLLICGLALFVGSAAGLASSPDDPGASVPADDYRPVLSGTKSYRPVEPLPWGDVNRRVGTPPKGQEKNSAPGAKGSAPDQVDMHKH